MNEMRPVEKVQAILVAKKVLDDASRDPDSDLSMMSRQFLRAEERIHAMAHALHKVREAIENDPDDVIGDTLWISEIETAVDCISAALGDRH